ncbi:unnamed protein product [Adineta ricciae]|uniref:Uncharacterized protein n=1 Tax=Adineta ricciae TaxID=249248 RepID=A0A814N7J2_ADIRI|nr:unnamed protein product [Adineta ricciae]CAF1373865.1 unnamed protein product [Adineta ricciae]
MKTNRITVVTHNIVKVHNSPSIDPSLVVQKMGEPTHTSYFSNRKRKVLCAAVFVVVVVLVMLNILIPIVVVRRNKTHSSSLIASTPTVITTTMITGSSTITEEGQVSLVAVKKSVKGVHHTVMGGSSMEAGAGDDSGHYLPYNTPAKACDNDLTTKYVSFGPCYLYKDGDMCGLNTGFYLELQHGPTIVNALRICTANDSAERDPTVVSLEGSHISGIPLIRGTSWTPLYKGASGLEKDPGRSKCGPIQHFDNAIKYKSYRFLVSGKRSVSNSVQYSEVQLYKF